MARAGNGGGQPRAVSAHAAEFDLIARIRALAAQHGREDVVLGIGDDAALLAPAAGLQLAVATDTLNAGVHFPPDTAPGDIGWKALAVNLSDLAAMGAKPCWTTLSLSLPASDPVLSDALMRGFLALAKMHGVALVGGDTTRGPLSLSVTVMGQVAAKRALRRDGAQPGDDLWVSGTIGDAAAALHMWQRGETASAALQARLDRPAPRLALGEALAGVASACLDISDGLLQDLGHLCEASGVGADLWLDALPMSEAFAARGYDDATRWSLMATGGDDYELLFTAAPGQREAVMQAAAGTGLPVRRIGVIKAEAAVHALQPDGRRWQPKTRGWDHFAR